MHTHPSGRPATKTPINIRNFLVVPASGPVPSRDAMQDAWWHAKERQTLEDGTSARILPHQLDRLSNMIHGKPIDQAGSTEIQIRTRRNLLCDKLGFTARQAAHQKGGAV